MNQSVRRISEGAMMVAMVGLVLFFNRQTAGMFEYLFYWLLSFPILIYTAKYGLKAALIPAFSMLVLSLILSVPTTVFYLVSALIVGLFYGCGVKKQLENRVLLGATIFFTFLSYLVTAVLLAQVFGYGSDDVEMLIELFQLLEISVPAQIAKIALWVSVFLALVMSVLEALCIHLLAILLLKRLKIAEIRTKTVIDLQFPKWFGVISIIVILLFLGRNMLELNSEAAALLSLAMLAVSVIALANGCMYLMCILLLAGRKKWVFILPLMAITPIIQYIILFFGIYDMLIGGKQILKEAVQNGTIRKP